MTLTFRSCDVCWRVQEQRQDSQLLQQRCDEQRQQTTELRHQLNEMKLAAEDNTTKLELRKANDSLTMLRDQLDNAERKVTSSLYLPLSR